MTDVRPDDLTDAEPADRRWWLIIAVLVAARVAAVVFLGSTAYHEGKPSGLAGDVDRYMQITTARGVPYRDFQVEYPPATYLLIKLVTGADAMRSVIGVAVSQLLCDLGIAALLAWAWSRRAALAYLVLGLPLLAQPFVYARIDLFVTLLAVAAVALARRRQDVAGGGVLAAAVAAKIWPFALAPLLLIERRTKGLVAFLAGGLVMLVGWIAVASGNGVQQVLSFRDATGWQVESIPGVLWHLRDPSRIKFESGAFRTGIMPTWGRPLLTLVSLVFIAAAWWLAARRFKRVGGLTVDAEAPLACVLSLMLFAPILSPQYVVWVLPFAALLVARGDKLVGALTLAITVTTTVTYPLVVPASEGNVLAIMPVVVRNALLVALLVVAFQTLAGVRDRRAAGIGADSRAAAGERAANEPVGSAAAPA